MKVIFLDIDGVLNSVGYYRSRRNSDSGVDESRIRLLKKIVDRTGAKIVLSSSWRSYWDGEGEYEGAPVGELTHLLKKYGMSIYAKTPEREPEYYEEQFKQAQAERPCEVFQEFYTFAYDRVFEVRDWLTEQEEPVEAFVILDDNDFNWKILGYEKHWVKTRWGRRGLSPLQAEKAVKILNGMITADDF